MKNNLPRILFISQFYYPEFGAASSRITGLTKHLVKKGCDVHVITDYPNYPSGIIYESYNKNNKPEVINGVTVHRVWSIIRPEKSTFSRIANFVSFMISSVIRGIYIARNCDIIVASSPPLIVGLSGWFLARFYRKKFIFDIRDIWPSVAIEAGEFKKDSLLVLIAESIARFIYRHADHLTPVTRRKMIKLHKLGVQKSKITIIENGIDPEIIIAAKSIDVHNQLDISKDKIISVYAGLIGVAQGVQKIIQLALDVKEEEQFHFLIIGDGVEKEKIKKKILNYGLNNITLLPRMPRDEVIGNVKSCQLAIIPLVNSNIDDAIPSKLLEAWGCSIPVLLLAQGESQELVEAVKGGRCAAPEDRKGIRSQFLDFSKNNDYVSKGKNGFQYVHNNLTRLHSAEKLYALCTSLKYSNTHLK